MNSTFLLLIVLGLIVDACLGDPVYRAHPIRILGSFIVQSEKAFRRIKCDGYGSGIALVLICIFTSLGFYLLIKTLFLSISNQLEKSLPMSAWVTVFKWLPFLFDLFCVYSLIALRDLLKHASKVAMTAKLNNEIQARNAISMLVGRDVNKMSVGQCCRAAVESLAENLADGVIAPLFWLSIFGVPGLIVFKVASTLDSMVGYKSPRYIRFGWAGARLDDLMCYVPARLTFLLFVLSAALLPGFSAKKAFRIGRKQHALIPGPNPGWPEASAAGALQRRLIGPVYKEGVLVTELWIGELTDLPADSPKDVTRMQMFCVISTLFLLLFFFVAAQFI